MYLEQVYPHTNADELVLELEFQRQKTEVGGTVVLLKNLFVKFKMELVNRSGAVETGTAETQAKRLLLINNLGQSLHQNVDVVSNGTTVSSSVNLHPYKAILQADLS